MVEGKELREVRWETTNGGGIPGGADGEAGAIDAVGANGAVGTVGEIGTVIANGARSDVSNWGGSCCETVETVAVGADGACCGNEETAVTGGAPSQKSTARSPEEVKRLLHRLHRMEGQIRGICGMVERGAYCPDILVQAAAVSAAMNAFCRELLESHIRHCVVREVRAGDPSSIDELVRTIEKLLR